MMRSALCGIVLAAVFVGVTATASQAQQTSSSSETKKFEILAVDGNNLVVSLPEGTKELAVPDDFRFTVNGQSLSVHELKPGMKGTATITTQTTVTPVTVTEVKNGTVYERSAGSITVQTPEGFKRFSQGDLDKRGVKIVKGGKPVDLEGLNKGDKLSATIVTSMPPRVLTKKEVQASVATPAAASVAPVATAGSVTPPPPAASAAPARTLPKTASSWPLVALMSVLSLAAGFVLTFGRRLYN
jgi:hypothetical protein